jgi:hypothetical protein
VFEAVVVGLTAITGPFVFIPVGIVWWTLHRRRWTLVLILLLGIGVILQGYSLLTSPRTYCGLGASLRNLLLILSDRVVLAGLFAEEGHTYVYVTGLPHGTILAAVRRLLAAPIAVFAGQADRSQVSGVSHRMTN